MNEDKIKQLRKNSLKNYYKIGLDKYFGKKGENLINNVTDFRAHPWIMYLSQDEWRNIVKRDYIDLFKSTEHIQGFDSVMSEVRDNMNLQSRMNDRIAQIRACESILNHGLYSMNNAKANMIKFPKKDNPKYDLSFKVNNENHYASVKYPDEWRNIIKNIKLRLDYESIMDSRFKKSFILKLFLPNCKNEKEQKEYYSKFIEELISGIKKLLINNNFVEENFIKIPFKNEDFNKKHNQEYGVRISYDAGETSRIISDNSNILEEWTSKKIFNIYGYIYPKILTHIRESFLEFYKLEEHKFNENDNSNIIKLENCHLFYLHDIPSTNIKFARDYLIKSVNNICKALDVDEYFKTDILLYAYEDNYLY